MKTFLKSSLLTVGILILFGGSIGAEESNAKPLAEMRTLLEIQGLDALMTAAEKNAWKAPQINSAWFVVNLPSKELHAQENEKRAFGKVLEQRISENTKLFAESKSLDEISKKAESLLRLADWIEASMGYGNLFLAARCRDIASVGVGKLVVDLNYPLEKAANLVVMITWPSVSARANVLNHEMGTNIFPTTSQEDLEKVWQSGSMLLREQKNPNLKAARVGNPPAGMEELAASMRAAKVEIDESPEIVSNLKFFEGDVTTLSTPPTTANTWDKKWHQKLVDGFQLPNATMLQALTKFRSIIGFFPTEPVKNAFYTGGEGAFDTAWRSTKPGPADYKVSAFAWKAYNQLQQGKFLDEESKMLNRAGNK